MVEVKCIFQHSGPNLTGMWAHMMHPVERWGGGRFTLGKIDCLGDTIEWTESDRQWKALITLGGTEATVPAYVAVRLRSIPSFADFQKFQVLIYEGASSWPCSLADPRSKCPCSPP
jgi:hypothetical protein